MGGQTHKAKAKEQVDDAELRRKCCSYARKQVAKLFDETSGAGDHRTEFPCFEWSELVVGKVLGKGGFGTVREIKGIKLSAPKGTLRAAPESAPEASDEHNGQQTTSASRRSTLMSAIHAPPPLIDDEVESGEFESRKFIANHCIRNGGDSRYAVKILSPDTITDTPKFLQGLMDLVIEARLLSSLEHPNIIKLRGLPAGDLFYEGSFIVLDRLYDTLEKKIKSWDGKLRKYSGLGKVLMDRRGDKWKALYLERILAAYELSSAFAHVHEQKLVYRDCKAENVAFDLRGDIKIFDFGLARELRNDLRNPDGTYRMTEATGSPRYIAPEIANGLPYNQSCDVYSFAILLWQMLSCLEPYGMYTPKKLRQLVYVAPHKRPLMDPDWNDTIKNLLRQMWHPELHDRCSMKQVRDTLREEVVRCRGGKDDGIDFERRRSTYVFQPRTSSSSIEYFLETEQ